MAQKSTSDQVYVLKREEGFVKAESETPRVVRAVGLLNSLGKVKCVWVTV
jgi:hypothetical protein